MSKKDNGKDIKDEKKVSRFLLSIDKFARDHQDEILKEIEKIENEQILKAENDAIDEAREIIQKELENSKNKVILMVSEKRMYVRREVYRRKNQIIDEIFSNCSKKISEFVCSSKYSDFLFKLTKKIIEHLKSDSVVFFLRKEDSNYINELNDKLNNSEKYRFDLCEKIKVGGIIAESENIIIDETFESKILEARIFFLKSSKSDFLHKIY